MSERDEQQIHPATPYHREQSRRRGKFAKSTLLTTAFVACAALAGFATMGQTLSAQLKSLASECFSTPTIELRDTGYAALMSKSFPVLSSVAAMLGIMAAAVVLSHLVQTRFQIGRQERETDSGGRFFKKIFEGRRLQTALLNVICLTASLIGLASFVVIRSDAFAQFFPVEHFSSSSIGAAKFLCTICLTIAMGYFLFAGVDYLLAWWSHDRGLRMTEEELREQARDQEGDSQQRSRRREMHRNIVATASERNPAGDEHPGS